MRAVNNLQDPFLMYSLGTGFMEILLSSQLNFTHVGASWSPCFGCALYMMCGPWRFSEIEREHPALIPFDGWRL